MIFFWFNRKNMSPKWHISGLERNKKETTPADISTGAVPP
jgi:hypothetical protein